MTFLILQLPFSEMWFREADPLPTSKKILWLGLGKSEAFLSSGHEDWFRAVHMT